MPSVSAVLWCSVNLTRFLKTSKWLQTFLTFLFPLYKWTTFMKTSRGISSSWLISHMRGMLLPVMLVYYASSFVAYKVTDTLHLKSKYSLKVRVRKSSTSNTVCLVSLCMELHVSGTLIKHWTTSYNVFLLMSMSNTRYHNVRSKFRKIWS